MLLTNSSTAAGPRYPRFAELIPCGGLEYGRFRARFAQSSTELDEILRLRFNVFNLELAEGLDSSWRTRRDEDDYDLSCHHLLVEEKSSGRIVGTYRLQTTSMAAAGRGFYSAGEFDLSGLPGAVLENAVEIGRACIAAEHRHRFVLFLLWQGLARYLVNTGKRYYFGCCSVTSQDPAVGWRIHRQLGEEGRVHPALAVEPLAEARCERPDEVELGATGRIELPTLFRTYLRYGALVCSPPAIDRQFKTIDFLILFDRESLDERRRRVFFGTPAFPEP